VLIGKSADVKSSEITPFETYLNRRHFIGRSAMAAVAAAAVPSALLACESEAAREVGIRQDPVWSRTKSEQDEQLTSYEDVTSYNNFYE